MKAHFILLYTAIFISGCSNSTVETSDLTNALEEYYSQKFGNEDDELGFVISKVKKVSEEESGTKVSPVINGRLSATITLEENTYKVSKEKTKSGKSILDVSSSIGTTKEITGTYKSRLVSFDGKTEKWKTSFVASEGFAYPFEDSFSEYFKNSVVRDSEMHMNEKKLYQQYLDNKQNWLKSISGKWIIKKNTRPYTKGYEPNRFKWCFGNNVVPAPTYIGFEIPSDIETETNVKIPTFAYVVGVDVEQNEKATANVKIKYDNMYEAGPILHISDFKYTSAKCLKDDRGWRATWGGFYSGEPNAEEFILHRYENKYLATRIP